MMPLLVDAHEDIAWNMLTFGRDYRLPVAETRRREHGTIAPEVNGDTLLGWPEFQAGRVAIIFSSLYAAPLRARSGEWDTQVYADSEGARARALAQLDVYHRLQDEQPDHFRLVLSRPALEAHLAEWRKPPGEGGGHPVGLVPLMEGADAIRRVDDLEEWWQRGLRLIGPAWMGTRYCGGTREPGPLTDDGRALLEAMADLGFILDLSHMDVASAREALDRYEGALVATHANALKLIKGSDSNRHLTDEIIDGIIERGGVIGCVPYNLFLVPGWKRGDPREGASLDMLAAHIDYVCQRAGDARHAGLGSDFDGIFGLQHVPPEIDTIADLHKLGPLLEARGYNQEDVAAIFGGNWIDRLGAHLPNS